MNTHRHKGFTLIELLIVMVIIAILSLAMIISGEEVQNTARATQIINDLNAWKRAALAYWADNQDEISKPGFILTEHKSDVMKYLQVDSEFLEKVGTGKGVTYTPVQVKDGAWYIYCDVGQGLGESKNGIKAKLAGRAKSIGLMSSQGYSVEDLAKNRGSTDPERKGNGIEDKFYDGAQRINILYRVR